jgi:hypothetical protein
MKESAPLIMKLIKKEKKITAPNIARILDIPIRRVYDVTILLEALELIKVKRGRAKLYIWKTSFGGDIETMYFNTNRIKITASMRGTITKVKNHPEKIIVEGSTNLIAENYVDYLQQ